MSEKHIAAQPAADVTKGQQNDISAQAIANNILHEISMSLKPGKTRGSNDEVMHNTLASLKNDPLQDQVINQLATDASNSALMSKYGISGGVKFGADGKVDSLVFSNADTHAEFQKDLLTAEAAGSTPTQALKQMKVHAAAYGYGDSYDGKLVVKPYAS